MREHDFGRRGFGPGGPFPHHRGGGRRGRVFDSAESLLLEMGLVEETSTDGARKSFAITDAGRAHLAENEKPLAAARSRLEALAEAKDRADPAPLRRAMGNLREVLIIASRKPGFDEKKILESARLIDELAGTIERL